MVRGILLAALAVVCGLGAAQAQGIDCSKARTPVEKAICASPELVALDRQIGAAYADAVARQPDRASGLRGEALAWLHARDAACGVPAARFGRCLAEQMTARLAQLAPPAPTAPAPTTAREPAVPSAANPPAPEATVEPAAFAAAEQTAAVLRVTSPGRFALAAHSSTGVALQLVDQLTGPAETVGDPGLRDGRMDVLLDIGAYRLRAFAAKGAEGEVRLSATPFRDAAPPRALPQPGGVLSADLHDGEQRAFWLLVPPSGAVEIEAAGRALADLRLWRAGRELTALEPAARTIEPQPGHTLLDLRLAGTVEPGVYLAVAYGGPALPWADGSAAAPFHLRGGLSDALAEGWAGGTVGPFGSERYAAPAFAGVFRLDLPAPAEAELRVDGRSAVLAKSGREPRAALRAEAGKAEVIEVRGAEGQPFTLRAGAPATSRSVTRPGTYWVAAAAEGAGADEAPPTVLLERTDPKLPARIVAGNLPRLAPGAPWRGRFNLRGPTSLLFENTTGGKVAVSSTGISLGSEPGGYAQYDVPADIYVLRLRPAPGAQGVIDVTVGARGAQAPLPPPLPADPVIPLGVQEVGPGQTLRLLAQSGPGLATGLVVRPVPVALAEGPVAVTQTAGSGAVSVPVEVAPGGTLSAREMGGGDVAVADARRPDGVRLVTIPASERPRTVVLAWRRAVTPADIPAPPPEASLRTLRPGPALPFDLAREEQRGFALDVAEGGLYRVETLGRLRTSGRLASAFVPLLDRAEANGAGENMLLQDWLRAGRYRVDVRAVGSAGHGAIAASPAPLLPGGALAPGGVVRAAMPAGSGAAFPVRIAREGRYRVELLSLGEPFTIRLDDAEGWPVTRPGRATELEQTLRPGTYRLLVSPEPVARRVAARLREVRDAEPTIGHGPHPLPFGAPQSATWREPPGRSDPRAPDLWTFDLAGPADVTLTIADGMVAGLRQGDRSVARLTKQWSGRLEAGAYAVEATSLGRNDRLDYTIGLAAKELQPGEARTVGLPATLPFALAAPGIATVTSWGTVPVKATLRRADGTEVVRIGARADDWNLALSRPLPAGAYLLELAAALPPSGGAATPQDRGEDEDRQEAEDQEAQTTPRAERPEPSQSAEAPEGGVEVRLILPTGEAVQTVPVLDAAPGRLIAASATSEGEAVLALERQEGDGWRVVAIGQGGAPMVAAPADADARPWRVEAWAVDGGARVQVQAKALEADAQGPGAVELRRADGVDLAVARVGLPGPGVVDVEGAGFAAGWPGHGAEPVEGGQTVAQGDGEIWLIARAPGPGRVMPVQFAAERAVTVPAGGSVMLPALAEGAGRVRLWRAESGAGQPGLVARQPSGIAANSGLALASGPVRLGNAEGAEALPVQVAPLDLRALAEGQPGGALLPPSSALPVRLPGGGRVSVTLAPGTAALGTEFAAWAAETPLTRDFFAEGAIMLVNTTAEAAPVALGWTAEAALPPLRPGVVVKRFFGAAGSLALRAEGTAGATATLAGEGTLQVQDEDGKVRSGRGVRIENAARVTVTHGTGPIALAMAAPGVSPWPEATPREVALPLELPLSGPAMALALAPETPVLLHATTTAPLLLGLGDRPPELFASGAEFHRALPAGPSVLRLYSPHEGPLAGTLRLAAEPIRPAQEGVGESVAVAPGGSAAFGFSLAHRARVGIGVRAEPDRAEVRLLDAKGAVLGEGVAQLVTLAAGRFVLEARVPPDAAPTLIRPAIVGISPRGNGPPPDVVQSYLELVGLKPVELGK